MQKAKPRDLRTHIVEGLNWFRDADPKERSQKYKFFLKERLSRECVEYVAGLAGLDAKKADDIQVLVALIGFTVFIDRPKGAPKKNWRDDLAFLTKLAAISSKIDGDKLSSLVKKLRDQDASLKGLSDERLRKQIERAYTNVAFAYHEDEQGLTDDGEAMTEKERSNCLTSLFAIHKFLADKRAPLEFKKRGAYKR